MAKQIEDIILRLKQEGFENIDKLKGAFRGLANVTNATETQLAKTRKEIIDFGKESTNSIAVIKGQIAALKGLQQQADVNGTTFKKLKADVKAYEAQLKSAEAQLDSFNTKVQSIASIQSGFEKLGVPGLESQLSKRQKSLAQQTPLTNEYVTALGGVIKVETALTRLYERQNVIAASARTVKFTPARGGTQDFDVEGLIRYAGVFQTLPNTNAAYAQVLKEVRQDLANVDRGTEDYLNTLLRLTYIQRDASRVTRGFAQSLVRDLDTGRAARSAQNLEEAIGALRAEMAQLDTTTSSGSAEYARNASAANRLQRQLDAIAQSYKAVSTNAAQATNAQTSYANAATVANYFNRPAARAAEQARAAQTMPMPPREISSLYNQIGQIGMQPILGNIEMMGNSYETVANDIRKATAASDGSINSLQAQRAAWEALRNTLGDNKLALREVDKELTQIDRQLARRGRGGGRLSGMQLAQGVGAALSGGIFGGPEGLIGGLAGLPFGVGGAFAGAAFGAQVGMSRQQLGGVTDYSARIDKLQIALRGIVGSQDAYTRALAAADSVTRDLNIPQEVAIQGMTRLSAAVKGAGGTVSDSAFAFRAVSEAVKATGGNAEQADGALLALTQVFSKGKVSAEELNQIAERLPGTFTLFAKAAGMTGPQLQKALQEGQVGLNDLMKFLQLISTEYGQTALKIAASSQEAGARLSVAMKNMQLEVGRALQPIGASLQSAFADFITKITPSVVSAMKGIAAAFEFLIENKTASGLATFALQLGAVTAGLIALRSAMATLAAVNIASMFTTTAASAKITGDVLTTTAANAGGLTTKLAGLRGAVSALALSFAKPIILTVGIAGVVVVLDYLNKLNAAKDRLKRASTASRGENWLQEIGGSATDVATLRKQVQAAGDTYQYLADKIKQAKAEQATTPFKPRKEFLQKQIDADLADLAVAQSRYRAGINALAQRPAATSGLSTFPTPATDDEKKKKSAADKAARDAQAAAAEQQRLANTLLDQQLRAADRVFQHQIELDRQRYELQKRLDDAQAQNRILRETGAARDIVSNFEDLQRSLREIEERRVRAVQDVRLAKQTQQSAAVRATFDAQGAAMLRGTTGVIARTGSTGQSTGPHLDARWADGRRITAADADRYLSVNGRAPSSYGVTSPYGPRSLFGRNFHAGIDFGTPSGSGITLKNGATLLRDLGFTGAGGYAVEINTKDGPMRLLHLQRGSARMPAGAATQQNRAIKSSGGAVIEGLDVTQAEAQQQLIEINAPKERAALFEQFTLRATDALKQQNKELRDSNELQKIRNRLASEGVSPERINVELKITEILRERDEMLSAYRRELSQPNLSLETESNYILAFNQTNELFAERIRLLQEAYIAQENYNSSLGGGFRDGAQAYVESIGTMREATAQLAQTGIKGVEDAIFSLTATGKANFQEFAKSVLESTSRMIIQQLILRSVMQIIGAIGGSSGGFSFSGAGPVSGASVFGSTQAKFNPLAFSGIKLNALGNAYAANGIVPFAMGGVVNQPTLFKFANGGAGRLGLMGEAGPEAIMPLRRLPNGRLGVEQAGGGAPVTVNVSVDATGTSVQGNAGQGEQLGRVISQAVQAELVRQQRPGGLLSR